MGVVQEPIESNYTKPIRKEKCLKAVEGPTQDTKAIQTNIILSPHYEQPEPKIPCPKTLNP